MSDLPGRYLERLRQAHPLVHNITNYVVMNTTANALLAIGAAPVMAHAQEEVADMAALADALVLNIGTLEPAWVRAMLTAGAAAGRKGIPIVLDPVGAGATPLRTDSARRILAEVPVSIVRGNASEIMALDDASHRTRGVDATDPVEAARSAARRLAARREIIVAVTGAVDYVTDGQQAMAIANGHPLMSRVTGTGCMASALVGAFAAVPDADALEATVSALAVFGCCGEAAADSAGGPGSFQVHLLDALYTISPDTLKEQVRINDV